MNNVNGLGAHGMWGFSTTKDLLTLSKENINQKEDDEPIHILLLNTSDPRHIFSTISKNQFNNRPLYFYILESPIEATARQLLLLYIFMDVEISIRNRAALFLEVFGNCLIKERTEDYIEKVGKCLTEMMHDTQEENGLGSMIDFSLLKFKERDALEVVFKSWRKSVDFDVINYRDYRLRGHFRDRYDCRKNLIDWDYFSKIKNSASIIHIDQYRDWRMSGIAFEFGNNATSYYKSPNRSFASNHQGQVKRGKDFGLTKQVQGYWCDVVVGPYIPFGVELCSSSTNNDDGDDNESFANDLFRIENKGTGMEQHRHNSGEVSMFNIISLMWEFENGKKYKMKTKGDIFSGLSENNNLNTNNKDMKTTTTTSTKTNNEKKNQQKQQLPQQQPQKNNKKTKIKIIPIGEDIKSILKKNIYKNKFDIIYISLQAMISIHNVTTITTKETKTSSNSTTITNSPQKSINDIFSKNAMIFVETTKYVFPLHSNTTTTNATPSDSNAATTTTSKQQEEKNIDNDNSFIPTFMKDVAKENNWKEIVVPTSSSSKKRFNTDTLAFHLCKDDKSE